MPKLFALTLPATRRRTSAAAAASPPAKRLASSLESLSAPGFYALKETVLRLLGRGPAAAP